MKKMESYTKTTILSKCCIDMMVIHRKGTLEFYHECYTGPTANKSQTYTGVKSHK